MLVLKPQCFYNSCYFWKGITSILPIPLTPVFLTLLQSSCSCYFLFMAAFSSSILSTMLFLPSAFRSCLRNHYTPFLWLYYGRSSGSTQISVILIVIDHLILIHTSLYISWYLVQSLLCCNCCSTLVHSIACRTQYVEITMCAIFGKRCNESLNLISAYFCITWIYYTTYFCTLTSIFLQWNNV